MSGVGEAPRTGLRNNDLSHVHRLKKKNQHKNVAQKVPVKPEQSMELNKITQFMFYRRNKIWVWNHMKVSSFLGELFP